MPGRPGLHAGETGACFPVGLLTHLICGPEGNRLSTKWGCALRWSASIDDCACTRRFVTGENTRKAAGATRWAGRIMAMQCLPADSAVLTHRRAYYCRRADFTGLTPRQLSRRANAADPACRLLVRPGRGTATQKLVLTGFPPNLPPSRPGRCISTWAAQVLLGDV